MANKKAEAVTLIKVVTEIGKGVEGDPIRDGIQYWDTEGNLLFEIDAVKENNVTYEALPKPYQK